MQFRCILVFCIFLIVHNQQHSPSENYTLFLINVHDNLIIFKIIFENNSNFI